MVFNGKHLSLEDRNKIEENIRKGLKKFETAKELNKSQSTIGKKIKNKGGNLNTTELFELAHIICPLIKQGQSIGSMSSF